ncbi:MAG: HPr family phosphocarrier protein [Chloroflexota bacterium]|nr:HPr family phosphocarrier protein [Chloroflexota bacterium]
MSQITLTIRHEVGLHARPAALFVKTARQFDSDIRVTCRDRQANAKSILGVLTLSAGQNAVITIDAAGDDADAALTALQTLVENNFVENHFGETG